MKNGVAQAKISLQDLEAAISKLYWDFGQWIGTIVEILLNFGRIGEMQVNSETPFLPNFFHPVPERERECVCVCVYVCVVCSVCVCVCFLIPTSNSWTPCWYQFWHHLPRDSIQSCRQRAQSQQTVLHFGCQLPVWVVTYTSGWLAIN